MDDEPSALEGIGLLVRKDRDIDLLASCSEGEDAISKVDELKPDLLFLDIQMPVMNGFEVLNRICVDPIPVTVFVTAYDQYAIKAFEANASDYLLKPFSDQRFYQTLEKAKMCVNQFRSFEFQQRMLQLLDSVSNPIHFQRKETGKEYLTRIFIKDFKGINFLNVDDIRWITADDYYATIRTRAKNYLLRETMNNLELRLDPGKFIRISRSMIININLVKSIEHYSKTGSVLYTHTGECFKMSLSRLRVIKEKLGF